MLLANRFLQMILYLLSYEQIVKPVQWIKAIQSMRSNGIDTFYEISSKPTLAPFIKDIAGIDMEIIDVQDALINCENT